MTKYIYFLALCIPIRLMLSLAARKYMNNRNIVGDIMAFLLSVTATVWFLMFIGVLHRDIGMEAPGGVIWWQRWRILHATMYALCVLFYIQNRKGAYRFLIADAIIGLGLSVHNHLMKIR